MSQVSEHLEWCLKKAKKELKEGKKHRGITKVSPDVNNAIAHVLKAEHNLKAITYFQKGGFGDWSASAAFYTIYHCFLAILAKHGYESRNQECTISVIQYLIEESMLHLDQKWILAVKHADHLKERESIMGLREAYQYGVKTEVEEVSQIQMFTKLCSEMIESTKQEIYNN